MIDNIIAKFRRLTWRKVLDFILTRTSVLFNDRLYLKLKYRLYFNKELNLANPTGFNEKLNWLKLNYRKPEFTRMVDKNQVKEIVSGLIGTEFVVPCYGYWKSLEEIEFEKLPERVFLKSTHDSGGGILVDKSSGLEYNKLQNRFNTSTLKRKNWYWHLREYPYKNIKPGIIAEQYLDEGTGCELQDYKFYCFNGVPMYMYITNKGKHIYENFYDMNFTPVDISHGFERRSPEYTVPKNFKKMKELASILSEGLPFIRIDFFNVGDKVYFGEFTFYDWGGMKPLNENWEIKLGELINLNLVKNV